MTKDIYNVGKQLNEMNAPYKKLYEKRDKEQAKRKEMVKKMGDMDYTNYGRDIKKNHLAPKKK